MDQVIFGSKNGPNFELKNSKKMFLHAVLASHAAGSSIAVSNDNYVRYLYLSESEFSEASNISSVSA